MRIADLNAINMMADDVLEDFGVQCFANLLTFD